MHVESSTYESHIGGKPEEELKQNKMMQGNMIEDSRKTKKMSELLPKALQMKSLKNERAKSISTVVNSPTYINEDLDGIELDVQINKTL